VRVVHAIWGDPEVSKDGGMYAAMGYTAPACRRKPGRKRKVSASPISSEVHGATTRRRKRRSRLQSPRTRADSGGGSE
jgi:hypothetical protein